MDLSENEIEKVLLEFWRVPGPPLYIKPEYLLLNTARVREYATKLGVSLEEAYEIILSLERKLRETP